MNYRQWTKRRTSRRNVLGTAAVGTVGAASLALVGCGDDDDDDDEGGADPTEGSGGSDPEPTTASGEPKRGGTMTLSLGTPTTEILDPHSSTAGAWGYWPLIANRLMLPHAQTLEPVQGEIIEDWEQVSETELLLTVRPGVTFHEGRGTDGREFVADDVVFNLRRIRGEFDPERSAQFQRASTLLGQDQVEAVDERTVKISFSEPNSLYIHGLTDWRNLILAPETVESDPNFTDPTNWSATGPFMIDKWDAATLTGEYVRNPNYWKEGKPYLDGIQQLSIPDTSAQQSAFLSGGLDFYSSAQQKSVRDSVEDRLGDDGKLVAWDGLFWNYLSLNQQRMFSDPQVRKAMQLVIKYTEIMNLVSGEGFWTHSGPIASSLPGAWTPDEVAQLPGYNEATKDADIAEAKALMAAAGYEDGDGLSFSIMPSGATGDSFDIAIFLQGQLQEAFPDIDVSIDEPGADFFRRLAPGDYDMVSYVASSGPSAFLDPILRYRTGGTRNYTQFSDPAIDALIDSAVVEFDLDAQNAIAGELEQLMFDAGVYITVGLPKQVNAVNTRIKGFEEYVGPGTTIYPYDASYGAGELWIDEA